MATIIVDDKQKNMHTKNESVMDADVHATDGVGAGCTAGDMSLDSLRNEIDMLSNTIKLHDDLYYNKSQPLIDDHEYDKLRKKLESLCEEYAALSRENDDDTTEILTTVGAKLDGRLPKIRHTVPMLSLDNVFSYQELCSFIKRLRDAIISVRQVGRDTMASEELSNAKSVLPVECVCEPKYDGLSFSAIYDRGYLVRAATRGDGVFGEDVTENIVRVGGMPTKICYDKNLEIRGEVYMRKADFLELNNSRATNGERLFANPRNAAAGSLRQLDANITAARNLRYAVWGGMCDEPIKTQWDLLQFFKGLGFCVERCMKTAITMGEMQEYYDEINFLRSVMEYDVDGVVFKVNDISLQKELGAVSRFPRWAIAYKFPGEQGISRILDISVQVSRHGVLTPVAELEPVNIGGVLVSRATLHNEEDLRRRDIRIGDVVVVKRAGGVIPKIESVELAHRSPHSRQYSLPAQCPVCASGIVQYDGEVFKRCSGGIHCTAQIVEKICHFVSKHGMNIEGFGEQQVRELYSLGWLREYADIWEIEARNAQVKDGCKLELLSGWGAKSVHNLFMSIDKARVVNFENFLYALGIRHVGREASKSIALHYKMWRMFYYSVISCDNAGISDNISSTSCSKAVENVENVAKPSLNNSLHKLTSISGVGTKTAHEISEFFRNQRNTTMLDRLLHHLKIMDSSTGYNIGEQEKSANSCANVNTAMMLKGKVVVFTGTLVHYTREEAERIVELCGAKTSSNVSKKTDYIVAGYDAGSKLSKGLALGIKILSEEEWSDLISKS